MKSTSKNDSTDWWEALEEQTQQEQVEKKITRMHNREIRKKKKKER